MSHPLLASFVAALACLVACADDAAKKPVWKASDVRDEAGQNQMQLQKRFGDLSTKAGTLAQSMARSTSKSRRDNSRQLTEALDLAGKAQIGPRFRTLIGVLNKGANVDAADEALDQCRQIVETLEVMLTILETDSDRPMTHGDEHELLKKVNQVDCDQVRNEELTVELRRILRSQRRIQGDLNRWLNML